MRSRWDVIQPCVMVNGFTLQLADDCLKWSPMLSLCALRSMHPPAMHVQHRGESKPWVRAFYATLISHWLLVHGMASLNITKLLRVDSITARGIKKEIFQFLQPRDNLWDERLADPQEEPYLNTLLVEFPNITDIHALFAQRLTSGPYAHWVH